MDIDRIFNEAHEGHAEAQYQLAVNYLREGNPRRGHRWLEKAVAQKHGPALNEAGLLALHGVTGQINPAAAIRHFEDAVAAGYAEAHVYIANQLYSGHGIAPDRELALRHLQQAVMDDIPAALRLQGLICTATDDATLAAMARPSLHRAAQQGDGHAQLAMARQLQESDPETARYWLDQALAARVYCVELAERLADVEPGAAPDLVDAVSPLPRWPSAPTIARTTLNKEIGVHELRNILSREECDYLIASAAGYLRPSMTVHPQTGQPVLNDIRTSDSMNFHPSLEDIALFRIKERMASVAGTPVLHAEPFAVLRYRDGQEYKEHYDFIRADSADDRHELGRFGQRQSTLLCYLSDAEGGATVFPRLGLEVQPTAGGGVLFRNIDDRGAPDERTLHAGRPVTGGEKWLATIWFREYPFILR